MCRMSSKNRIKVCIPNGYWAASWPDTSIHVINEECSAESIPPGTGSLAIEKIMADTMTISNTERDIPRQ